MSKRRKILPPNSFVASKWWGYLVLLSYWARRKPLVLRYAPPVSARWIPPADRSA